jgi:DNA-binding NtrC family response regulator
MENNVLANESKILIVDDDKNVRLFLERYLKQKGYSQIQLAEDGMTALKVIQEDNIRLVLLDIRLPDINGVEVLRKIKSLNKNINVIMITAFPDEALAKEVLKDGACDYMLKPFDLAYLKSSVHDKIIACTQP